MHFHTKNIAQHSSVLCISKHSPVPVIWRNLYVQEGNITFISEAVDQICTAIVTHCLSSVENPQIAWSKLVHRMHQLNFLFTLRGAGFPAETKMEGSHYTLYSHHCVWPCTDIVPTWAVREAVIVYKSDQPCTDLAALIRISTNDIYWVTCLLLHTLAFVSWHTCSLMFIVNMRVVQFTVGNAS